MKATRASGSARMVDVARLAGVSTMTVSRVLNSGPNVTEAMRQRVHAAVEELRYQPNELARSLREQRSRQIGIILPYLFDPFFAMCAHAISTVARKHAYSIVLATCGEDASAMLDEATRMLRRNVDGLVLVPPRREAPTAESLLGCEFDRLPVVSMDRPMENSTCTSVLVENEAGACRGTEHLIRLGHRRITHVALSTSLYTIQMRQRGYEQAMQAAGLKAESVFLSGDLAECTKLLRPILQRTGAPTALFCSNNLVTRHVLHCLQTMQIRLPQDLALVGFDDFEMADLVGPGITVVRQPVEQLGRTAAQQLFEQITAPHSRSARQNVTLPVELVVRGSCGAALTQTFSGQECRG